MNEPLDSRPQRTVNRLRLLVLIPAAFVGVGIVFLGLQLARHFREIKEPPARDYPPSPPAVPGAVGRSIPAAPRSELRADTTAVTPPLPGAAAAVSSPATSAGTAGKPVAGDDSPPALIAPVSALLRGDALPARGIVGWVFLRGAPPAEKVMALDPSCGILHAGKPPLTTRLFVVGAKSELADVFVVLKDFPAQPQAPPVNPLEIRQRGCEYLPYVSAARVGQTVRVFNDDPLMHNVHPTPTIEGNREQNRAQLNAASPPLDHNFSEPEQFLRFKCDVHPWMFAYVSVVEHPFFAVSAVGGQFALPEPPPGNYTLQLVHRKAGTKLVPVTQRPGKRLVVNVTLDLADPAKSEAVVTEE